MFKDFFQDLTNAFRELATDAPPEPKNRTPERPDHAGQTERPISFRSLAGSSRAE